MQAFSLRLGLTVGAVATVATFTTHNAHADRRMFTNTYEYKTVPEGHTALELWHTESRDVWDKASPQRMNEVLELEHGITDHWDMAVYTIFDQVAGGTANGMAVPAESLRLSQMSVESRYRFADRGEWPVDVLVYGEFVKGVGESAYEGEVKGIFARDFDKLTVAANLILEMEFGKNVKESEPEFGYAVGGTYEVHPKVNVGVESFGKIEAEKAEVSVGPAVAIAPSGNYWLTFTAGFGATDAAPALSGRLILGLEL